ncbi:DUF4148 domain-containing protein [Noviherbaspirillum denitrificans]|uniref:DUF4148 domain-containing protein n=1 Tax=Noviherbaspirillum denitrificans TaxID=1968433 RepID=A0A254TD28_9BURK|nr:DUF4148 domain-containing protein [Noviherbaspirillum denitrificans]OWW20556.1 hypothetical protein AYR66_14715 [Noviherbaspirillum denitrificans]
MNAKQIVAAFAILAATGSAFAAGNSEFVEFTNVPSTKTRAEVRAELAQAREQQVAGSSEFVEFTPVASTRTREEVRREAVQSAHSQSDRSLYIGG